MSVVAHAAGAELRPVPVRLAVAVLAGFGAAAVANFPMSALPEGEVPKEIALAAVWPDVPESVVPVAGHTVHYLAGILVAIGIELALVATAGLRGVELLVFGWVSVSRLAAGVGAAAFVTILFGAVVLPRVGPGRLADYAERAGSIRLQWTVSAAVYGLAVALLVPALYVLIPV
ncbi:hypothetical protein [Halostella litorea]|uniref:hypothetical protein n=1 Tax=Halostella litorea TaxID=2528831 RepID=UPI0010925E5B|nr:hypothetical protein [Halostella litorea]